MIIYHLLILLHNDRAEFWDELLILQILHIDVVDKIGQQSLMGCLAALLEDVDIGQLGCTHPTNGLRQSIVG